VLALARVNSAVRHRFESSMRPIHKPSAVVIAIALVCGCFGCASRRGSLVDRWETANRQFKIRVTQYQGKRWFGGLPGYYYVFESAVAGSGSWHEIMTARTDDPVPIPHEQVHLVNDRIGYLFMSQTYAVTMDGGLTWSTWNTTKTYADTYIKEVRVVSDGTGIMTFYPNPTNGQEAHELHTNDFGRTWHV
jgi:hypothetical protein